MTGRRPFAEKLPVHYHNFERNAVLVGLAIVLIISLVEKYLVNDMKCLIYKDVISNTNTFAFISLVGISLTAVGVWLAYKQLNASEDRFFGYEEWYAAAMELLLDNKKKKKFQFWGSTLLPGQIVYNNKQDIKEYRARISALAQDSEIGFEFITLSNDLTTEAYQEYKSKQIDKFLCTTEMIAQKLQDVNDFKDSVHRFISEIQIPKDVSLVDSYYFSNGYAAVYAIPLHYLEIKVEPKIEPENSAAEGTIIPCLIGFKTTNPQIVKSFSKKFEKIKGIIEKNNANNPQQSTEVSSK